MKKEKYDCFEFKNGEWQPKESKHINYYSEEYSRSQRNFGRWFIILMIIMFFGSLFGGCPVIYLG